MSDIQNPKVFISYSWTSEEYQERVTNFVNKLRECGIDTIYDKYDLEAGASIHTFMEKSVVDSTVDRVLILCDGGYVEKADNRIGGAGIETLIISPKVYEDADPAGKNKKFIPIIMERYNDGKVCVPAYLNGRIYFDFSSDNDFVSDEFIKLVRFLYGKSELRAPTLGKVPTYVIEKDAPYFGTNFKRTVAVNALKESKQGALKYCEDFFDQVCTSLDDMCVNSNQSEDVVEEVWTKIVNLLPLRNDVLEVIDTIIACREDEETLSVIKLFLERLLAYTHKYDSVNIQVAHYDFFVYEIFTYLITILLKRRKFSQIPKFLTGYYYKSKVWTGLTGFGVFYPNDEIFDVINNRRKKTFVSFRAEVVKERSNYSGIDFEQLMQTDLLLYIFYLLRNDDKNMLWYPQTLIYKGVTSGPFELFLRATSKSFYGGSFLKMGISIDAFKGIREKLEDHRHYSALGWANLVKLSNIDNIATQE